MKAITKAEFNRRLAAVERARLKPRVGGAGEFVGGALPVVLPEKPSTSSPASLTDFGISTTRCARAEVADGW